MVFDLDSPLGLTHDETRLLCSQHVIAQLVSRPREILTFFRAMVQ